jgi:hypothetical protein
MGDIIVRRARSEQELQATWRLAHDIYVLEGYIQHQPDGMYHHYDMYDKLPDTAVFVAIDDGRLVGTISICNESYAGTPFEKDFPDLAKEMKEGCRLTNKRLAYVYRLLTLPEYRNHLDMITMMLHGAISYGCRAKVHIAVVIINPKHVLFYKRILGFHQLTVGHTAAANAPGVVMQADTRHLYFKWQKIMERRGVTLNFDCPFWPTAVCYYPWWFKAWEFIMKCVTTVVALPIWILLGLVWLYNYFCPTELEKDVVEEMKRMRTIANPSSRRS